MANDVKRIIEALNVARAAELAAISQYMGHHYEARGIESAAVKDIFKETAVDEMKHAEKLAERIVSLGGIPTRKIDPVKRGGTLKEMLKDDLALEKSAIKRYKEQIKLCEKLDDTTTRRILEDILMDEEGHSDEFSGLL
jgi:bacterioferritin